MASHKYNWDDFPLMVRRALQVVQNDQTISSDMLKAINSEMTKVVQRRVQSESTVKPRSAKTNSKRGGDGKVQSPKQSRRANS